MKRTSFAILIGLFCLFPALFSQVRSEFLLEKNWKFAREDCPEFINPTFNDSKWQSVTVPHDWAIYGPFSSQNDKQEVAIAQDGQTEAMEHAGRTGGLPFVGVGWYRTEFEVPQFTDGKRATILFDGAMSHAKVYVNGQEVGYWPYGYNSFYFDITKQLIPGKKNTLAVRLENLPESSRWYPGAGLCTCNRDGKRLYPGLGNLYYDPDRHEGICESQCTDENRTAGRGRCQQV